jgi:hypothetical protein
MSDKLERVWKKTVVAYYYYYLGICLEALRKSMTISVRKAGVTGDSQT